MADTIITLTSPEGATLNTAGTYCESDIEVVPNLQSKVATTGEIVTADEGYVGLKSVDATPAFEAGKKSENDAFWKDYQSSGNRGNYDYAFAGIGWSSNIFDPRYSIDCNRCQSMFSQSYISGDLEKFFADRGLSFSTSKSIYMSTFASYAQSVTAFPAIDVSSATDTPNLFQGCSRLERVTVKSSAEIKISTASFMFCRALTDLTLVGTISFRGLDLSYSPLNKSSLTSVVNALSATTTGLTVTLRLDAVNTAFETATGLADGSTSEEWQNLVATKPNWTINLINS